MDEVLVIVVVALSGYLALSRDLVALALFIASLILAADVFGVI